METIKEARQYLKENISKGTECPCCNRVVKMYKRNINEKMVKSLIQLSKMGKGFHHVGDIVQGISNTGTNDFSKLHHWGMIKQVKDNERGVNKSGFWKITETGTAFVNKEISAPAYAIVYNKKAYSFAEEHIFIDQAFKVKFNYRELMEKAEE